MSKIEKFDRKSAALVGKQVAAAVAQLATEIGARVIYKGGTFEAGSFTCKVQFDLAQVDGVNAEEASFKEHAALYNLLPEHFGATIETPRGKARIVALQPGRSKRPIVIEYLDNPGKRFVIEDRFVRSALDRHHPWEKAPHAQSHTP